MIVWWLVPHLVLTISTEFALNHLTRPPFHPLSFPAPPSNLHAFYESLGDIRGYNPSLDHYCVYLGDLPRKVIWNTSFDHAFDFFMKFNKYNRAPIFFAIIFSVFSYLHHSEMHP